MESEKLHYIIFDFEWNSTHIGKDEFLNEIIEIGAVLLDEKLNEIDRFSRLICPVKSKKLNKYVRGLTHIDEQELKTADGFDKVFADFKSFCGEDTLFLSWSDTDLHVLHENYRFFRKTSRVDFIKYYADLQRFVMEKLKIDKGSQPSLAAVAERLEIPDDGISYHRACDDSAVCAQILRRTYDGNNFKGFVRVMDDEYYKRLEFKPYFISSVTDPDFDKSVFEQNCQVCGTKLKTTGKIKFFSNMFTQKYICPKCKAKFKLILKIRKTYDGAIKKIRFVQVKENNGQNERKD